MRILVVSTGYPTSKKIYRSAFIRPRVVGYLRAGHRVDVLNFEAEASYELDGVTVFAPNDFKKATWDWDLLVFHAPNLRNHVRFILENWSRLPAVCLTFHGHEARYLGESYPEPYAWNRGRLYPMKRVLQYLYDLFKLRTLRWTIQKLAQRKRSLLLLFVSEDFRSNALHNLRLGPAGSGWQTAVVWNPMNREFLKMKHHCEDPLADFLTIRPIDQSTYCLDLVLECARQNPEHTFHVYGEGRFFSHHPPPQNLTHIPHFVPAAEIPKLLLRYRGALMPSRCDSHGVMMCEMAVTGMPVLASQIPVHREALDGFPNVCFLDNENPRFVAEDFLETCRLERSDHIPSRFSPENTVGREIELFAKHTKV